MSLPQVFSHMAFYNPKPSSIQTFLAYFVEHFVEVILEGRDSFLLERRYLAFLLRKSRTNVKSEMEILQALLRWANISFEIVGLDFLMTRGSTENKLWVCTTGSYNEDILFHEVDLTKTAAALNESEPTIIYFAEGECKNILVTKAKLFRDIEHLLPLIRFPFITLSELSSLSPLERRFMDMFAVTGQLTNEAIALQLTPPNIQSSIQVLNLDYESPYKCPTSPCDETGSEYDDDIAWDLSDTSSKRTADMFSPHFRKRPRRSEGFPQELPALSKQAPLFPLSTLRSPP